VSIRKAVPLFATSKSISRQGLLLSWAFNLLGFLSDKTTKKTPSPLDSPHAVRCHSLATIYIPNLRVFNFIGLAFFFKRRLPAYLIFLTDVSFPFFF
jgi:hypothetical protein